MTSQATGLADALKYGSLPLNFQPLSETTVSAQLVDDYNPPRTNCCLAGTAQTLANQLQDWNALGRYHADDEKLKAQPPEPA